MISLDDVSVFIAVVEAQNFSVAARALKISPSAVSKSITRLEHELRAKLINRSSRRISLSAAGSAFFEKCAGIRPLVDDATKAVQSLHSEPGGTLCVHASTGLGIKLITPLIARFIAKYPSVSVDLITHVLGPTTIEPGTDIMIHQEEVADKSLEHRDLGTIQYAVVASNAYLQRSGEPRAPAELERHNCLLYRYEKGRVVEQWRFTRQGGTYHVPVSGNFVSNNSAALYEAASKGVGIALMPVYGAVEDLKAGKLKSLFRGQVAEQRTLRAYYPRSPHRPINVRLFLDFITIHVKDFTVDV